MSAGISRTPRFTRRETSASCGKFSMKDKLIPVGCNRLLGSAINVSIQLSISHCSLLPHIHLNCFVKAKRPTLGISGERPHNDHEGGAVARVRCMPLLCRACDVTSRVIYRPSAN
jgi:hypothetical protein